MDHNKILGVVLAGGKSQRFGEDKSQVKLHGKILIDYILSEIIDQFEEILIVTNNEIKFKFSKKISITKDLIEGVGPLGGILTAMKWIKKITKTINGYQLFLQTHLFSQKMSYKSFIKKLIFKRVNYFLLKINK